MEQQKQPVKPYWHLVFKVVVLLVVFSFGYGFGSGNIDFSRGSSDNLPSNLNYSSVEQVYDSLRKNYDGELNENSLIDGLKKGLVNAAGDPFTEFLTAEQTEEFNQDLNGTFSGIGAELSKEEENIIIVSPISGFPAEREGLKPKDIITKINGESAIGLSVTEAVDKIRGPEGTDVELEIARDEELKTFMIKRENITIPSVESKILEGNIGYIEITRFSDDTAELTLEAAKKFKDQNVKGVILDVRGNPGGLLDSSVDVASIWLNEGSVVLEERKDGETIKTYKATGDNILYGVPTVVLINEGSASASEIVAGALKDNDAAELLGQTSFGKGSVQSLEQFPDGSSLKVTIARWFTPNGQNIDKEGITPDTEVTFNPNTETDEQLQAAIRKL